MVTPILNQATPTKREQIHLTVEELYAPMWSMN